MAHRKPLRRHPGPPSQSRKAGPYRSQKRPRHPGRHHPRNGGRDHSGMVGDIERNQQTAIETTALDPNRRPTAAEVRAEVWMALIHGAKGIVYFVHEFEPHFREDAIFRYPDIVEELTRTNR